MTGPYVWTAEQAFGIEGSHHHEDTLRIENNYQHLATELAFELHLPTLCVTYADMKFANAIGGAQRKYPSSSAYGPAFFDPPVTLTGKEEVEKFTWIRGSHKVVIGSGNTVVYWHPKETLVIPRLRIEPKQVITAALKINPLPILLDKPLQIDVSQSADGRPIGGVSVVKQHPQWAPSTTEDIYDLWVRVVDGETKQPITEAKINLYRWDEGAGSGQGTMTLAAKKFTDGTGTAGFQKRPSGRLETVVLDLPGRRAIIRGIRSLPGQTVYLTLNAWKLREETIRYTWKPGDTIGDLALLTSSASSHILKINGISDASVLTPGLAIDLPCFAPSYRLEGTDTIKWMAETFCFQSIEELAAVNGLSDVSLLHESREVLATGWHFFYARPGDTVEKIENILGCPPGWLRFVGRCYHPDPQQPMAPEVVAIPTPGFVESHGQKHK